jgi:hypothetical protein
VQGLGGMGSSVRAGFRIDSCSPLSVAFRYPSTYVQPRTRNDTALEPAAIVLLPPLSAGALATLAIVLQGVMR